MNWRRYLLALLVTALVTLVADVILNAVIFRDVYVAAAAHLLPADRLNARVPLGWGGLVVLVAAFGLLFALGGWRGARGGLQFGAILALASAAGVAGLASVVAWPTALLLVIGAQQVVNSLLLGLLFGLLYRPARNGT